MNDRANSPNRQSPKLLAIVVTGDRHASESLWRPVIESAFDVYRIGDQSANRCATVIHGDQGKYDHERQELVGIDTIANIVASSRSGVQRLPMPYIGSLGLSGGPTRNRMMIDVLSRLRAVGYLTVVLAFHDDIEHSKGTRGCAERGMENDHDVIVYDSLGACARYQKSGSGMS